MNFNDCNSCSLCVLGCVGFQQTSSEAVTAQARNLFLQISDDVNGLEDNLAHCVQSGYCTAVCPRDVDNDAIYKSMMKRKNKDQISVFNDNYKHKKNLYGRDLILDLELSKYSLGGDVYSLQLGCSFLNDHSHRLPLLKSICEKYNLPFYVRRDEKCCARFLDDLGFEKEYQQACRDNRSTLATVHLDASCASNSDHSFWDFLFQKEFSSLEGHTLYVSTRWLNQQSTYRYKLLERFVTQSKIKVLNIDAMYLATGGVKSSWHARLGSQGPLKNDLVKGALVMEVSEVSSDNLWLLEVL